METLKRTLMGLIDGFANSSATFDVPAEEKAKSETIIPSYITRCDNYLNGILDNAITRGCLRKIADTYYADQIEEIEKLSTKLTSTSFPTLYNIYNRCCITLKIKNPPIVYVTNKLRGINALSVEVKERKLILLGRRVAISLPPLEQAFIIGHELGHHQQENLVCHTVNGLLTSMQDKSEIFGPMLMDTIEVPLKQWCRQSEFNADRAGYLCCQNLAVIKSIFHRIGMIDNPSAYHLYKETSKDHPSMETRYKELQTFISLTK